jgi:hypothetical protein
MLKKWLVLAIMAAFVVMGCVTAEGKKDGGHFGSPKAEVDRPGISLSEAGG